jgi:hypothetical protein
MRLYDGDGRDCANGERMKTRLTMPVLGSAGELACAGSGRSGLRTANSDRDGRHLPNWDYITGMSELLGEGGRSVCDD